MYIDRLIDELRIKGWFTGLVLDEGNVDVYWYTSSPYYILDEDKNWKDDVWKNAYVYIYKGSGKGQIRKITSNTKNQLYIDSDFDPRPDSSSRYLIVSLPNLDNMYLEQVKTLAESIDSKIVKVDTDNVKVVSEVAYDSDNDLKKIRIDADSVGLAKDSTLTALRDALLDPILDELILNNETIDSSGESAVLNIRGAKHVDVLIYVGTPTGNPSITFHLQIIEPTSGKAIKVYDGNNLTAEGPDCITIDGSNGSTLGTHIKITWDGTLDSSNYFSGCFVRVVAK